MIPELYLQSLFDPRRTSQNEKKKKKSFTNKYENVYMILMKNIK